MRTPEEVREAVRLDECGLNRCEIARRLGIPRSTVKDWLTGRAPDFQRQGPAARRDPTLAPPAVYSYLLGVYLGDGCISPGRRSYVLRIALDAIYPRIIDEVADAVGTVMEGHSVSRWRHPVHRCVMLSCVSIDWPTFIPQHGPGRKHNRRIELADWQAEVTRRYPREFIRGLIHTDGSRYVACQRTNGKAYRYARYAFSNRSGDIRGLFLEHLAILGIACRQAKRFNLEISRREAVAALDEFVGPKR